MIAKFTFNYNGGFEKKENAVFQQGSIGVDSYQVFAPFLTTTQVYIKTKRNGDLEFSLWKQLDYNSTIGGWLKTATQDELLVDGEMKVVFKFNNLVSQETSLWVRKGTLIVPEMTTYEALRDYVENQEIRIDQIINGATDIAFDKTGTNLNSDFVEEAIKEVNTKSDANAQNIADMKDGTTTVKKAEQDKNGNDIFNTYETKSDATSKLALKADKTYVDTQDQALDDYFENEITKFKDGTTIVKKAEQDKNSNDIVATYETKADATSKLDTIINNALYEKKVYKKRIIESQKGNDFVWKPYNKAYISFCLDDGTVDSGQMADLFIEKNLPLCLAFTPGSLDLAMNACTSGATKLDVMNTIYANGGEILSHAGTVLTSSSTEADFIYQFETTKRIFTDLGFEVDGVITAGGTGYTTVNFAKCVEYMRPYYRYSDYYGYGTGVTQYLHGREAMGSYNITQLKALVDTAVTNKTWVSFYAHSITDVSLADLEELLDYIISLGTSSIEVVTYKTLHDAFGSSLVNKLQGEWIYGLTINAGGTATHFKYRKDSSGVCTMIGYINKTQTSSWLAFTMPTGYRPTYYSLFPIGNDTSNSLGTALLNTNGQFTILGTAVASYSFTISYPTV